MRTFGSSGHLRRPEGSTLHNYVKCVPCHKLSRGALLS